MFPRGLFAAGAGSASSSSFVSNAAAGARFAPPLVDTTGLIENRIPEAPLPGGRSSCAASSLPLAACPPASPRTPGNAALGRWVCTADLAPRVPGVSAPAPPADGEVAASPADGEVPPPVGVKARRLGTTVGTLAEALASEVTGCLADFGPAAPLPPPGAVACDASSKGRFAGGAGSGAAAFDAPLLDSPSFGAGYLGTMALPFGACSAGAAADGEVHACPLQSAAALPRGSRSDGSSARALAGGLSS